MPYVVSGFSRTLWGPPKGGHYTSLETALTAEPALQALVDVIRREDAAFTNLDMSLHDYETYPMVESGGIHLRGDPALAKELVWAGFRLASLVNNHAAD